jgi:hypothetical protein
MIRERAGEASDQPFCSSSTGAKCARALLPLAAVLLTATFNAGIAAQTNAPPPAIPPATPGAAPAAPTNPPAKDNSAAASTAKKRKVFTDDDVPALRAKGGIANDDDAGTAMIYGTMGACDADCEQQVKDQIGVTEEQEGEWKLQMTAARREIGEDRQWRELYGRGQQAIKRACTLRTQMASVPLPSGNDYQSRLERAKEEQMFVESEKAATRQLQNVADGMSQYIQPFAGREPVRAVMMAVIGERLLNNCPDDDPH